MNGKPLVRNLIKKNLLIILGLIGVLLIPLFTDIPYILHLLIMGMMFGVVAASWDLTMGYAGVFNFGHIAFLGIGAYTSGILAKTYYISPWIATLAGAGAAVLASLIVGLPTLRLKGIYVCLFSFAFQTLISSLILINPYGLTGGGKGFTGIPAYNIGVYSFSELPRMYSYYLIFIFFIVSIFILYKVSKSSVGLSFMAIRDHENYAVSRGINPYKYKTIAWIISAFFTGLIGGVYSHYTYGISRELLFFPFLTIILSQLVVGGLGTIYGPVLGAFIMTFLYEYLRPLEGYRFIIASIIVLIVLIFARGGLAGLFRRLHQRIQRYSVKFEGLEK